jgi:hypothetical protein
MVLAWLITPQLHKVTNGYYLNHDNLILGIYLIDNRIATAEDRKKLIFYFIASQTPEKLDPADQKTFKKEQYIRYIRI